MGRKLNLALQQILAQENRLDIKNIKYQPRWIILSIDISVIILCAVLMGMAFNDLTGGGDNTLSLPIRMSLVVCVNIIYFFVFHTYAGLIRHSSFLDALKIMLACLCTFVSLLFINYTSYVIIDQKFFSVTALAFYFLISFSLLFLFRLTVKQIYKYFKRTQENGNLQNTVIFGADENAISIARALETEHPKRFNIKGFITNDSSRGNIRKLGKPVIYNGLKVNKELKALNATALVLSGNSLTAEEKFAIVEDCLEHNIQVFNGPVISNYEDEKVSYKIKSLQIEDLLNREPIQLNKENKRQQLTGKTILVTGGAGSIGSEIVSQVAGYQPEKLLILDQAETPLHNLRLEIQTKFPELNFKCIICDVGNRKRLDSIFKKSNIDVIYHAAAYKHVPLMEENPQEAVFVNIQGTMNMADLAVKYNVGHFVMVSTDKAVNPSNVMGASKRAAEMYVQSLYHSYTRSEVKTKFITTRFGNVLGSNGSVVPLLRKQIEKGGPVTITHPDIIRYFMTIPEACQLVLEAGAMGKGGEIFIFDMGEPVKIMDLAIKMIKLAGFAPDKHIGIKITGLRPGEKLYEELLSVKSKTLPTHHKKIMIVQDQPGNYDEIKVLIETIISAANKLKAQKVVAELKNLVPEFKSNNSAFEKLDKNAAVENGG